LETLPDNTAVLFHRATCLDHLGRLQEAIAMCRQVQARAMKAGDEEVAQKAAALAAGVEARMPTLTIKSTGAISAMVDAKPVQVGAPVALNPGDRVVVVEFSRGRKATQTVRLVERERRELPIVEPQDVVVHAGVPPTAFVAYGVGAALGVAGLLAHRKANEYADDRAQCESTPGAICGAYRNELIDNNRHLATTFWTYGAAAVGTGLYLTFRPRPPVRGEDKSWWTPRNSLLLGGSLATLATLGAGINYSLRASSADDTVAAYRERTGASGCVAPTGGVAADCADLRSALDRRDSASGTATAYYVATGVLAAGTIATLLLWPKDKGEAKAGVLLTPALGGVSAVGLF
jgi:hypothetical protein